MTAGEDVANQGVGSTPARVFAASCVFAVTLLLARELLVGELQSAYFITGWISSIFVCWFAFAWWVPAQGVALERRIATHLAASFALVASLAIHVNFRIPNGVLDWGLTIWLAVAVGSLCLGRIRRTRRWLVCHVAISYGLAAASLFHASTYTRTGSLLIGLYGQ